MMKQNLYIFNGYPSKKSFFVGVAKAIILCDALKLRNIKMIVPSYENMVYDQLAEAISEMYNSPLEEVLKQVKGNAFPFENCGLNIKSVANFSAIYPYESVILIMYPISDTYHKLKKEIANYPNVIMCVNPANYDELQDVFSQFNVIEDNKLG